MENSEKPSEIPVDPRISRLRELQMKQNSGTQWTEQNRQELLALQEELIPVPHVFSEEEIFTLTKRQTLAGQNGEPPLTDLERKRLQELSGMR